MQTIAQAFENFLHALELHETEQTEASRQHINMREALQSQLGIADSFVTGSYARNTAVRPLNDIDIFLVLRETATVHRRLAPRELLDSLGRTLRVIYPSKTSTQQSRSVNIEFSTTGFAYDVVPAFADPGE